MESKPELTHGWYCGGGGRLFVIDSGQTLTDVSWDAGHCMVETDTNGRISWLIDDVLVYRRRGTYSFRDLSVKGAQTHD